MTKQELNRDIKRFYNKVETLLNGDNKALFYKYIETDGKKEFNRLYFADTTTEYLNKNSLVMMINLNLRYRFIAYHVFYINAKI